VHKGSNQVASLPPRPPAEEPASPLLEPELDETDMDEFAALDANFMADTEQETAKDVAGEAEANAVEEEEEGAMT
jgi:hypothetical protein